MLKISKKLKAEIFQDILSQSNPFAETEDKGVLIFLNKIWDLENLPSEDPRFENALGDVIQHTLANFDWDKEYLFLERLKLLDDDEKFELFIEALLSPDIRTNEDEITNYYFLLNPYLEKEGFALTISDFNDENFPIYKVITIEEQENSPIDLVENNIPFIVYKNIAGKSHRAESHKPPEIFPSFVLVFNNNWNDFSLKTEYDLFYYSENSEPNYIGTTKIMKIDDNDANDSPLEGNFFHLDSSYCSLGQTIEYYFNLKNLFQRKFTSVLYALKDAAFFSEINDKFENKTIFNKSLIRYDSAERLLREAKYLVYGYDLSNVYSFGYDFKPKFSDTSIKVNFDFSNSDSSPDRIYGIIGKNATGKTQLITSLPIDIAKNVTELFTPKTPLFSKVIAVSYSVFDSFEQPKSTVSFNYKYCGLKDSNGELISDKGLVLRFHHTWKKIKELGRMKDWREILLNFIEIDLLNTFIVDDEEKETLTVNLEEYSKLRKSMSSGQNILLYVISEIVANIRYDSLILYDEPETHLHPNAITQLVNAIYELVNKFESYCILATHSPLIIRELLSKNVLVIEREGNVASIRKIGIESFGENLTVLTEEVFGNRSVPKQHKIFIEQLVADGNSYEEIVALLESDGLPLSLNALMTIKSLTNEKP